MWIGMHTFQCGGVKKKKIVKLESVGPNSEFRNWPTSPGPALYVRIHF